MLDKTDFESWQQRIRLYCKGKDHEEYILQSIDEGPFKMGRCRDEIAFGSELTKDDCESQLYDEFEHFEQHKVVQCDAFDSDVDEAPTAQTMFMANLSSATPVYDKAGPSYDSNTLFEVQNHDNCLDDINKHHKEHEMQHDVQPNDVVDLDTEYTSTSNIISYEQYVHENEALVVQSDVSSVANDTVMMVTNDIYEQDAPCVTSNQPNNTVNVSLTDKLARYKELAKIYEKRLNLN
nr:retrovirus-related Pol polyprotein from transposon TNT 1-94 [Tanacetum cinerariifolium]